MLMGLCLPHIDPYLYSGVHVSLIGHDVERIKELGEEVRQYMTGQSRSFG